MTAALATFAVKLIPLCAPWNVFCKIAEKVEQGQYGRDDALAVARAVLYDSPQSLLGMVPRPQ